MEKVRVLFVQQEITPYLTESYIGNICRNLPQGIQEKGKEIRTFMPRFGSINERRNQLHEVIRLSGMNLIINNNDHPLIIKVASIQAARMQIYFIDNEDFFQRKFVLTDKNGKHFEDNDERSIFFCRGVIETVKKLSWSPDIIHCNGWFTGLTGLFIKKIFKNNPLFTDSKIVYTIYDDEFEGSLDENLFKKIKMDGITDKEAAFFKNPTYANYTKAIIEFADGVIIGSEKINPEVEKYLTTIKKPVLPYQNPENSVNAISEFYDEILINEKVLS